MANINDFKAKLSGGGARSNQYKVVMPFPGYAQVGGEIEDLAFLCNSAELPGMAIASIPIPFRGRAIKIAGDRTIADWTIKVINDTNFKLRNAFERWMNGINNMTDNEGLTNPGNYQVDVVVQHLDRNGATLKTYILRGAFPTTLDDITLSASDNDTVETFNCAFVYQYFETDTST